jgi:hypothetical protein
MLVVVLALVDIINDYKDVVNGYIGVSVCSDSNGDCCTEQFGSCCNTYDIYSGVAQIKF